jgi:hypothetical protein
MPFYKLFSGILYLILKKFLIILLTILKMMYTIGEKNFLKGEEYEKTKFTNCP